MSTDPFLTAFDAFAETVETTILGLRTELRAVQADRDRMLGEIEQLRAAQAMTRDTGPDLVLVRGLVDEALQGLELPRGEPGADGPQGERGEPGPPGEPPDEATVRRVVADVLGGMKEELRGPPGEQGPQGERGADGIATEADLDARLEERVREVQARGLVDYFRGTFVVGEQYRRSDVVAWDGCTWVARRDTQAKPGTDDSWAMLAKRGRDGRDRTR